MRSLAWLVLVAGCGTEVVEADDTDSSTGGPSTSSASVSTSDTTTEASTSSSSSSSSSGEPITTEDSGGSVSTGGPGSSSEDSSSDGSSSSESSTSTGVAECTPGDECVIDDDCVLPGATCIACLCIGGEGCESYGDGAFGDCLAEGNEACMGSPGAICVVDDVSDPQLGVCTSDCGDVCDCPAPPKGFESQLACAPIIDGTNDCFISCEGGLLCPEGWTCLADFICMIGEPSVLDPYGDCANLSGDCPDGAVGSPLCVGFLEGEVCTIVGCSDATDCPDAPATGTATVACIDLTGEAGGDCYLDCSAGQTCPDGMACHDDFGVCYWPGA